MRSYFLLLLLTGSSYCFAQKKLPMDSSVRHGKLGNGLTYYIKQNDFHKGHADFQMFHAVGAIQEEDNQNGLAHFLEHQAFKGLKRFPGKTMVNYLQTLGVKYGANLNAATTTDYTRYMMNQVPLSRPGIIDTCLMILADWSGSILATQEDIDSERGVIKEEWRTRTGAGIRTHQALAPYFFQNSKYANRSVIGDMELIETFKREELLDFYHKWYRPDLQAIAIVGDFDIDQMEKAVIEEFSKIPAAKNKADKELYSLPDNRDLIYGTYSDQESMNSSVSVLYKHPEVKRELRMMEDQYVHSYLQRLITYMMNNRWREISDKKDMELTGLGFSYGNLAADRDVFGVSGDIKPGAESILPALDTLLKETERFKRFGFTVEELELAKLYFKRQLERNYLEREKRTNSSFVESFFQHFIENKPVVSMEDSYRILSNALDTVSVAFLNRELKRFLSSEHQIVTVVTSHQDSAGIPSKGLIESKLQAASSLALQPYTGLEKPDLEPKVSPVAGKLVKEKKTKFGATLWELKNGAKVYLLPTEHKKDEILIDIHNPGGHSVLTDEDFYSGRLVSSALTASGVGNLTAAELSRALTGKIVYVTPFFGEFSEGFTSATTPTDIETTLKLIYMYFTEARFDEDDLKLEIKKIKENLAARKKNPFAALQDSVFYLRGNYHVRASNLILDPAEADKVDFQKVKEIYRKAFANPTDFTFVFTGAIDLKAIKPMIEKYIGGLKGIHRKDEWRDVGKRPPVGKVTIDFENKMETPKATTFIEYTHLTPYSFRKATAMQMLQGVLENRYNTLLRDEKSGIYTPSLEVSMKEFPVGQMGLIVSFETEPSLVDELARIVHDELKRLVKEGVSKEDLEKSKEYLVKSYKQGYTNNHYWQHILTTFVKTGRDQHTDHIDMLNEISAAELTEVLKEVVNAGNVASVIMRPETE